MAGGTSVVVERYERIFIVITVVLLALAMSAIAFSVFEVGVHLPDDVARVDPTKLTETPPFDDPGVRALGDGRYEAVIVAQAWAYDPSTIEVPAGAEVTFIVSSKDVIHGFMVLDHRVNAMVIPGQVTKVTATFDEPGEYPIICHEYCGIGHHGMWGRVVVTP